MDIPPVTKETSVNTDQTSYEYQKSECIKALNLLPKDKSTATVTFQSNLQHQVVKDLEEKGYVVKYTTSYSSTDKKTTTQLRIINPEIKDPLNEFFECFDGSCQYNNNEMNDKMKNLFVKFFNVN
tara:strand:- start:241 stop:615 length:375 start_codon:yes stop_codon:yes gene_type:complete